MNPLSNRGHLLLFKIYMNVIYYNIKYIYDYKIDSKKTIRECDISISGEELVENVHINLWPETKKKIKSVIHHSLNLVNFNDKILMCLIHFSFLIET